MYFANSACIIVYKYSHVFICTQTHAHRQIEGTISFSQAESVEPCESPWEQTRVVHAKRGLHPPSVENSDNESLEGEMDER